MKDTNCTSAGRPTAGMGSSFLWLCFLSNDANHLSRCKNMNISRELQCFRKQWNMYLWGGSLVFGCIFFLHSQLFEVNSNLRSERIVALSVSQALLERVSHLHTSEGRSHHLGPNEETSPHIRMKSSNDRGSRRYRGQEWSVGSELRGEGRDFGIASAVGFTVSLPAERNSLLWALLVLVNGVLTKRIV